MKKDKLCPLCGEKLDKFLWPSILGVEPSVMYRCERCEYVITEKGLNSTVQTISTFKELIDIAWSLLDKMSIENDQLKKSLVKLLMSL